MRRRWIRKLLSQRPYPRTTFPHQHEMPRSQRRGRIHDPRGSEQIWLQSTTCQISLSKVDNHVHVQAPQRRPRRAPKLPQACTFPTCDLNPNKRHLASVTASKRPSPQSTDHHYSSPPVHHSTLEQQHHMSCEFPASPLLPLVHNTINTIKRPTILLRTVVVVC